MYIIIVLYNVYGRVYACVCACLSDVYVGGVMSHGSYGSQRTTL